jgi:hypothetical protein
MRNSRPGRQDQRHAKRSDRPLPPERKPTLLDVYRKLRAPKKKKRT